MPSPGRIAGVGFRARLDVVILRAAIGAAEICAPGTAGIGAWAERFRVRIASAIGAIHSNPQPAAIRHQLHFRGLAQGFDLIRSGLVARLKQQQHADHHARR